MKKIGIITLNGYFNFGNRLQNYALSKVFRKKGYKVDTIWSGEEINLKSRLRMVFVRFLPYNQKWKRERKFYKFTKKNMHKVNFNTRIIKKYDIFVAGSDQVWNYESVKNNINYLIPFAINQKIISYAASMGNSDLPEEYIPIYKKYLSRYDYITVREEKAKELLKSKVGLKNIDVVIDPTLLLSASEWEKIEVKPVNMISKKYILCYFLGDMDKKKNDVIKKYAKENDLDIIDILDKNSNFYCSGPEEFIYFIHNASLICTDSFHSCVFSFVFNRPFVVFKRNGEKNKMYSRIDNFIKSFHFANREFDGKMLNKDNLNHDYTEAYKILNKERKKANDFMKKVLK